jgi:hypothetical protein
VRVDHLQFVERHRQEPSIDGIQVSAGAERVAQLFGRRVQPRTAERGDGGRVGCAARDSAQHAARTGSEQVRDETRHFDVRFLQQALQAVLELHAATR